MLSDPHEIQQESILNTRYAANPDPSSYLHRSYRIGKGYDLENMTTQCEWVDSIKNDG